MKNLRKLHRTSAVLHFLLVIATIVAVLALLVTVASGVAMMIFGDKVSMTANPTTGVEISMSGMTFTDTGDLKVGETKALLDENGKQIGTVTLTADKVTVSITCAEAIGNIIANPDYQNKIYTGSYLGEMMLISAVCALFVLLYTIQFTRLFYNLKKGETPFTPVIVSRIRGFAWLLFFNTILGYAMKVGYAMVNGTKIQDYFSTANLGCEIATLAGSLVVCFIFMAAIFTFARVIRYGAEEVENFD